MGLAEKIRNKNVRLTANLRLLYCWCHSRRRIKNRNRSFRQTESLSHCQNQWTYPKDTSSRCHAHYRSTGRRGKEVGRPSERGASGFMETGWCSIFLCRKRIECHQSSSRVWYKVWFVRGKLQSTLDIVLSESLIELKAAKRALAKFEGVEVTDISPVSRFLAGGIGGVCAQFSIYPLDTLKFRVQCESVQGGPRGNALIRQTIAGMWRSSGVVGFYRGLPMGVLGIFPYRYIRTHLNLCLLLTVV